MFNTIMSIILVAFLVSTCINLLLYVVGWVKAIILIKKYGWLKAGNTLLLKGDRMRGSVILVAAHGDKWYKMLMAIPVIGSILSAALILLMLVFGKFTIGKLIVLTIIHLLCGWMIFVLHKYACKALKAKGF